MYLCLKLQDWPYQTVFCNKGRWWGLFTFCNLFVINKRVQ